MPTVKLVEESTTDARVRAVFDDIKRSRNIALLPYTVMQHQ